MPHLMHFFTITWMPVSAPWNVKTLAACATLIGLVRGDLHRISRHFTGNKFGRSDE